MSNICESKKKKIFCCVVIEIGAEDVRYDISEDDARKIELNGAVKYHVLITDFLLKEIINYKQKYGAKIGKVHIELMSDIGFLNIKLKNKVSIVLSKYYKKSKCIVDSIILSCKDASFKNIIADKITIEPTKDECIYTFSNCEIEEFISHGCPKTSINIVTSNIHRCLVIGTHNKIELKNNDINLLVLSSHESDELANAHKCQINILSVTDYTSIKQFKTGSTIKKVKFSHANIETIIFLTHGEWLITESEFVRFSQVLYCQKTHFRTMTEFTWELVRNSSLGVKDNKAYRNASYEFELLRSKNTNPFARWFLKHSTGFGYKPFKAILFVAFCILLFAFAYIFIDLIDYCCKGYVICFSEDGFKNIIEIIRDRLYYSIITFTTTGYGEVGAPNVAISVVSLLESCSGVCVLSMFVYSLTKSHLK